MNLGVGGYGGGVERNNRIIISKNKNIKETLGFFNINPHILTYLYKYLSQSEVLFIVLSLHMNLYDNNFRTFFFKYVL